ncbi:hypothetical protein EJ08DRAFT_411629 [Tothia fuscella]|uniref:Uncharacterized protein n=1 Tax=Tothia fuscella TaxID=1048955 RepID=A0A9P4TVQ6_9PEZI|nr:hypothetical protein EJ08DRAFT_411629 [Tothia fuscella]
MCIRTATTPLIYLHTFAAVSDMIVIFSYNFQSWFDRLGASMRYPPPLLYASRHNVPLDVLMAVLRKRRQSGEEWDPYYRRSAPRTRQLRLLEV